MAKEESAGSVKKYAVGAAAGIGVLTVFAVLFPILKSLFFLGLVGGVGYGAYRWLSRDRAITSGKTKDTPALPGKKGDNFEARFAELERLERELDKKINS